MKNVIQEPEITGERVLPVTPKHSKTVNTESLQTNSVLHDEITDDVQSIIEGNSYHNEKAVNKNPDGSVLNHVMEEQNNLGKTEKLLEESKKNAFEEGYRTAKEEFDNMYQEKIQDFDAKINMLESMLSQIQEQYKKDIDEHVMGELLAEVIYASTCQIVGDVYSEKETLFLMIEKKLKELDLEHNLKLLVNPQEFDTLSNLLENVLQDKNLDIVADACVEFGGFKISTNRGGFDFRLDVQLSNFKKFIKNKYSK